MKAIQKSTVKLLQDWRQYANTTRSATAKPDRVYKDAFKATGECSPRPKNIASSSMTCGCPTVQGQTALWLLLLPLLLGCGIAVSATGFDDVVYLL